MTDPVVDPPAVVQPVVVPPILGPLHAHDILSKDQLKRVVLLANEIREEQIPDVYRTLLDRLSDLREDVEKKGVEFAYLCHSLEDLMARGKL